MKTNLKAIVTLMTTGVFALFLLAFTSPMADDWDTPPKYKSMSNTYAKRGDTDGIGQELYKLHCRSCHGKEGYGDGTKAGELDTPMRDLTSEEVQKQSDGEIYYKSFIGRNEMPNFMKKIGSEEDRWLLVNYIRSMSE